MRLIDADELIERMYHNAFESDTDMQKWDSGCWIRYKMFENAMDSAPTVEERKKGKWIPCSERLPEDEQPILFSTTTGRVHQGRFYRDNSVNQWYSSLDKMRAYNNVVNAWMPLPEPYGGGQDGN